MLLNPWICPLTIAIILAKTLEIIGQCYFCRKYFEGEILATSYCFVKFVKIFLRKKPPIR